MRKAASTACRNESFIGASYRVVTGKAIEAIAHQLARLIYAMLTQGHP